MNIVVKLLSSSITVKIIPLILISFFLFAKEKICAQVKLLSASTNVSAHPRILLLQADEEVIKKRVEKDSAWKVIHQYLLAECDRILTKPLVEHKLEGKRLLSKSRECRKRIFYLSYAWRMTGAKKYFDRVEKELLNVSAFKDWNPSHFLDVAEMTMAVAIGYDWLYKDLSINSRTLIKEAIITKGLEPSLVSENN